MASSSPSGFKDLAGKVAIVTGASSGLGQATAILFACQGAFVCLCGRNSERLKNVLDLCCEANGGHKDRFTYVQGDLNDKKVREEIVGKTIEKFGRLDVLVANAGLALPDTGIDNASEESFDAIFNTNLKSVFFLIQQALPYLENTKGNIVTVSSIYSSMATAPNIVYAVSKAAVDHMTRCLALNLGPKGIRVNAVQPSLIPTRMRRHYPGSLEETYRDAIAREIHKHPTGEIGTPEDIAEAIVFLVSDSAKFINGECIRVDGGRLLSQLWC